jgi:hypothetical protein
MMRADVDYGLHINYNWKFIDNPVNDFKFHDYNSLVIGAGKA